jgi:hypothetical protein
LCERRTVIQPPVELGQDLPVVPGVGRRIEDRGRVSRNIANRQQVEHQVIVVVLEGRRRWQDDVGMTGRFIEVEIDRHHEFKTLESALELNTVRGRQDRVARDRDQGPDSSLALGQDLFRQGRNRQLAAVGRKAPHPTGVLPKMTRAGVGNQVNSRPGEHGAAGSIEVFGNDVEYVHQPLAEPTERLCRHTEPSITDRGRSSGESSSEVTNRLEVDARRRCNLFGREGGYQLAHRLDRVAELGRRPKCLEPFTENDLQHRHQEQRVAPRSDEEVFVCHLCGLSPPGVDHDQPSTTLLQVLEPPSEPGSGHHAAVRNHRVGAENEQKLGSIHVWNGQQQLVAEHQGGRHVVRQLVNRSGGKSISGPQGPAQWWAEEQRAPVVDAGVPHVQPNRIVTRRLLYRAQPVPHLIECLIPAQTLPGPIAHAAHRMAKTIGIAVDVLEGHRLGADVAAAERVIPVAPDRPDFVTTHLYGETADRLA